MTVYQGTLPYGTGTIKAYIDSDTSQFKSSQFVKSAVINDKGAYRLSLPAGTYRLTVGTVNAAYPSLTVTATDGTETVALTLGTPVLRNAPTELAVTQGGGSGGGTVTPAAPTINFRGPWTASTAYVVGDLVTYVGAVYRVKTAHTSAATFAAGNFDLFVAKGENGSSATGTFSVRNNADGSATLTF